MFRRFPLAASFAAFIPAPIKAAGDVARSNAADTNGDRRSTEHAVHGRPNITRKLALPLVALCSVFIGGLLVGRLSAATIVGSGADYWQAVVMDARPDVVHGGIDAYMEGWQRGSDAEGVRLEAAMSAAEDAGLVAKGTTHYLHDRIYQKRPDNSYVSYEKTPVFSKTFGAYGALIDNFYSQFSAPKATFGAVLGCLADNPQVSCSDVAKISR